MPPFTLDHKAGWTLGPETFPIQNIQALDQMRLGLQQLAMNVRANELKKLAEFPVGTAVTELLAYDPQTLMIANCFDWFAVTLCNYLRTVRTLRLIQEHGWTREQANCSGNAKEIRTLATQFVKELVPDVYVWRNKVSAHLAITSPTTEDNPATLEQSLMCSVAYQTPHYVAGLLAWHTGEHASEMPHWALTRVYEDLTERFWPDLPINRLPKLA
jgi:hypothetical protein